MRRIITVGELERMCNGKGTGQFLFRSEEQDWNMVGSPVRFCTEFQTIQVAKNPDIILLKNGADYVYFQRINRVALDSRNPEQGTLIHIYCASPDPDGAEIRYTIVDALQIFR